MNDSDDKPDWMLLAGYYAAWVILGTWAGLLAWSLIWLLTL